MRLKLAQGHASVDYLKGTSIVRLMKLRNPWGKTEWKGEFSDSSSVWQSFPELKNILSHSLSPQDGIFFIRFEDWIKYYDEYTICYYYDKYTYSSQRYEKKIPKTFGGGSQNPMDSVTFLKFRVNKEGNYFIGISQPSERNFSKRAGSAV